MTPLALLRWACALSFGFRMASMVVLAMTVSSASGAPTVTMQPQSQTVYRGETATFSVRAEGLEPLSYVWRKDGSILGATGATLRLPLVLRADQGAYIVQITDAEGSGISSDAVTLTVIDPTVSQMVVLTPQADTSIYSSGGNPQGTSTILAGTRGNGVLDRGLLRFNFSTLPAGAVVVSDQLSLRVVTAPRSPANSDFSLHRMLKVWGADATWTQATAGIPWAAPGGMTGIDFATERSATRFISGRAVYNFGPSPQLVADINGWINNPASNYGWLLKTESEGVRYTARHFGSSESLNPPSLSLEYFTGPPPPQLTDAALVGGNFSFRFAGTAGWIYRVEASDLAGAWTTVTNAPAGAGTNPIVIGVSQAVGNRFYRVRAE